MKIIVGCSFGIVTFQFDAFVCSKPLQDFNPGSSGNQTSLRRHEDNRSGDGVRDSASFQCPLLAMLCLLEPETLQEQLLTRLSAHWRSCRSVPGCPAGWSSWSLCSPPPSHHARRSLSAAPRPLVGTASCHSPVTTQYNHITALGSVQWQHWHQITW